MEFPDLFNTKKQGSPFLHKLKNVCLLLRLTQKMRSGNHLAAADVFLFLIRARKLSKQVMQE